MAAPTADDPITRKAREIATEERKRLLARTTASKALHARALRTMPLGVASSFQAATPHPIYVRSGEGPLIWDVDGTEYVDFHNGFGSMPVGHAHPKIVEAITRVASRGTHFAATTPETVALAEELCRRFRLERVRFVNSGTEATMDAIRLARGCTGRDVIVKVEGSYHGHHDSVMFSMKPAGGAPHDAVDSLRMSRGVPSVLDALMLTVPFNDLAAVDEVFARYGDTIACLIVEPIMMNIGLVLPDAGYLASLRDICHRHGALVVFDEVKSGATVAAGGATELFGVVPDLACFAKAIGGGTPLGAFGGRADVMDEIGRGVAQQGTFNGNPLSVATALAALTDVLTPEAYEYLTTLGARLADGCRKAIADHGIPAHVVDLGAKGCVSYREMPLRTYRDFLETNSVLFEASWAWLSNRGVFLTPGNEEQWTLSVQHGEVHIDRYIDAFSEYCATLVR